MARTSANTSWMIALRQPAPWIALVLLAITVSSTAPRLWFWLSLLLIVLLVGWVQAFKRDLPPGSDDGG